MGVYRRANAEHVARLLEPALAQDWRTAWWALDEVAPTLATYTVGEGPGEKFPLVNEALRHVTPPTPWTIVSDDDVRFRRGDVVVLVDACRRSELDVVQPARAPGTHTTHAITGAQRLARARRTTFVESGPLVVVGPRFRDRVLPLPDELGMGWCVEFRWFDLLEEGCRLGIVDETTIEHVGPEEHEYETEPLHERLHAELAARGRRTSATSNGRSRPGGRGSAARRGFTAGTHRHARPSELVRAAYAPAP